MVGHSINVRALTDRSRKWQDYATKGQRYYNDWRTRTGPDAASECDFDDFFKADDPRLTRPRSDTKTLLQSNGDNVESPYYLWSVSYPKDNPTAGFINVMSGSAGVFLAMDNRRGEPGGPKIKWQFSQVAWWMWQRVVKTESPNNPDYSTIKSFWRRDIKNDDTNALLDEAFAGRDTSQELSWSPTEDPDSAFWPLLGSPNGNGIQYFLTDNKVAVKGKGITKISAVKNRAYYQMWATIEPPTS